MTAPRLRPTQRAGVGRIQRVRHSVCENRLASRLIADAEVVDAIERTGRGWVVGIDGRVNTDHGGRIVYWSEPDGHVRGALTVSYARAPREGADSDAR